MNSVQVHLGLTHVPVILSLTGLIMLIIAFFIKNNTLTKASYILLLIAGIFAIPVYFTGEGAEEAVENLPGVSETIIESHEEIAQLAMIAISIAGLAALAGLIFFKWQVASRVFKVVVLLLAITSGGFMIQTAHLGGQVRHTEVRSDAAMQNDNGGDNNGNDKQETRDD